MHKRAEKINKMRGNSDTKMIEKKLAEHFKKIKNKIRRKRLRVQTVKLTSSI